MRHDRTDQYSLGPVDREASASPSDLPPRWSGLPERRPADDLVGLVRRNVALIIGSVAVAVTAAVITTRQRVAVYEAWTTIRIDEKPSGLPALDVLQGLTSGSEVSTEQEILASRGIAEVIVDSLGLQLVLSSPAVSRDTLLSDVKVARAAGADRFTLVRQSDTQFVAHDTSGRVVADVTVGRPVHLGGASFRLTPAASTHASLGLEIRSFDDAVDAVRGALQVGRPNRDVNIVEVRFRGTDPALVQAVPNVAVDRFMALRQAGIHDATRRTSTFLREQSEIRDEA